MNGLVSDIWGFFWGVANLIESIGGWWTLFVAVLLLFHMLRQVRASFRLVRRMREGTRHRGNRKAARTIAAQLGLFADGDGVVTGAQIAAVADDRNGVVEVVGAWKMEVGIKKKEARRKR